MGIIISMLVVMFYRMGPYNLRVVTIRTDGYPQSCSIHNYQSRPNGVNAGEFTRHDENGYIFT